MRRVVCSKSASEHDNKMIGRFDDQRWAHPTADLELLPRRCKHVIFLHCLRHLAGAFLGH